MTEKEEFIIKKRFSPFDQRIGDDRTYSKPRFESEGGHWVWVGYRKKKFLWFNYYEQITRHGNGYKEACEREISKIVEEERLQIEENTKEEEEYSAHL